MVAGLSANRLRLFSAIALLFVLSSILMISVSAANNQEVALSTLGEAEQSMAQAYEAVLDAEGVGANVSGLLVRLNVAVWLVSQASMAFEVGDFEEAAHFSELASDVGGEVVDEAERLGTEAGHAGTNRMRFSVVGSVLGVAIVVCISLLGYRIFKKRYFRRLLKMRPRVGQA